MSPVTNQPRDTRKEELEARRANLHMQTGTFSERVLPALLIGLGVLTVVLIVIALTILLGIAPWR
jgi:hypothetical protein